MRIYKSNSPYDKAGGERNLDVYALSSTHLKSKLNCIPPCRLENFRYFPYRTGPVIYSVPIPAMIEEKFYSICPGLH